MKISRFYIQSNLMNIEHSIIVQNSLNEVFSHISNLQGGKEIRCFTNDFYQNSKVKLGTKYTHVLNILGSHWENKLEVISFIKNKEIKAKSIQGILPIEESVQMSQEKEGIRIQWKIEIQPQGISRLLSPVIRNKINHQVGERIKELKENLDFSLLKTTTLAFAYENDRFLL